MTRSSKQNRGILNLRRNKRGNVAMITAIVAVPSLLAAGTAVDIARLVAAKKMLQMAADSAAIAGASDYTDSTSKAQTSAKNSAVASFQQAQKKFNLGLTNATISAPQTFAGTSGKIANGNNVEVVASAKLPLTFMAAFIPQGYTVQVMSVASRPNVQITVGIKGDASSLHFNSSASDLNTVYLYAANKVNGKETIPTFNSNNYWQVDNNCGGASACKTDIGAADPSQQSAPTFISDPTQPLGFALRNVTGGRGGGYQNQYGSPKGEVNWFYSSLEANDPPQSPAALSNTGQTAYPNKNCSLIVQVLAVGSAMPSAPPASGKCFNDDDPASGYKNFTPSCMDLSQHMYVFWFNDMGGWHDDLDYNDASFTLTCNISSSTSSSNGSGGTTHVSLTQ